MLVPIKLQQDYNMANNGIGPYQIYRRKMRILSTMLLIDWRTIARSWVDLGLISAAQVCVRVIGDDHRTSRCL